MSDLTIKGAVKLISEVKVISDKFKVREFVVTIHDDKYLHDIIFSTVNDNISILDSIGVGQQIEVSFNLRGREYAAPGQPVRYYNTLNAWKVQATTPNVQSIVEKDDLPF